MSEPTTFIKLDRNIQRWRWYQDSNTFRVFVHLLLNANIEDRDFQKITIHRGELAASYETLATALGLSVKNVRTAIGHLKSTGEVAITRQPYFLVISVVSYDKYQGSRQASGSLSADCRQSSGSRVATIKEIQELNKEKNIKRFAVPTVDEVQSYCIARNNGIDAQHFINYYSANGWMVGRNKMRDWKAAIRTWEANTEKRVSISDPKNYTCSPEDSL